MRFGLGLVGRAELGGPSGAREPSRAGRAELSSFRRQSNPFASPKVIADAEKLCAGGLYEPRSLVNNVALAELGFIFSEQDEPKRRVVQQHLGEGPSGEIMISTADRKKLFKTKPSKGSTQARPPTLIAAPSAECVPLTKKRKGASSSRDAASASATKSQSPHLADFENPAFVNVAFPPNPLFLHGDYEPCQFLQGFVPHPDRKEIRATGSVDLTSALLRELGSAAMHVPELADRLGWYEADGIKGEEETLRLQRRVAKLEGEARASEHAHITAEAKARRLEEESEHVIQAFQASPAFEEAAFSRMDDLLKSWAQTPAGKQLLLEEGKANYALGLFRAQEVSLERFIEGKDLPEPCEDPEAFDSSLFYSDIEDAAED
ncbi:unnamed protein product [Cuscuta campestris]|uniref:Uncharacterized protein n=1 Tax=Cuscuta campestris TaxID=132261 RepID=A0A484NCH0_9ASTE|nr:unnamed protein product [Cuscuta campestris]